MKKYLLTTLAIFALASCGGGGGGGGSDSPMSGGANGSGSNSGSGSGSGSSSGGASGSGSSSGSGSGSSGSSGPGGASEARYTGGFTGNVIPDASSRFSRGSFSGIVTAEADFADDEIDVEFAAGKNGAVDKYEAEFDDARITNGGTEFSGSGEETLTQGGTRTTQSNNVSGSFNSDKTSIRDGKFDSGSGTDVRVQGTFNAAKNN